MKIAIAQLNPKIGDIKRNCDKIKAAIKKAADQGADLLLFSECILTGYPPKDLLLYPAFIAELENAILELIQYAQTFGHLSVILGTPRRHNGGTGLINTALYISPNEVVTITKSLLPNYDVFDEPRYFTPGNSAPLVKINGHRVGIVVCEDMWNPILNEWTEQRYEKNPVSACVREGAELIVNISASPYRENALAARLRIIQEHQRTHHVPFIYVNQVGANDELVFDGRSMAFHADGRCLAQLAAFQEDFQCFELAQKKSIALVDMPKTEAIKNALVLGIRDYVHKLGFQDVILGLSGGIDSALTACLAVEALGPKHVRGYALPSKYSSKSSLDDAIALAKNLGISVTTIPIESLHATYETELNSALGGAIKSLADENLQSRIRGTILMTISNHSGALLLNTGNKSELAVGYCTLYGDMNGALSVLSDVYKTTVYEVAHEMNKNKTLIPESSITKAPSAELRHDQKDQDSLPPYEVLDAVIQAYVEKKQSISEIVDQGFEADLVTWIVRRIDQNEFKRRQAPPGLKLTSLSLVVGRKMPIVTRGPLL